MAQRIEEGWLIVSCDFCGTDWDGQSAVMEGHRGAIICLECLKVALGNLAPGADAYKCILCLRDPIPAVIARWHHEKHPDVFACRGCVHQAADVFDRDSSIDWIWTDRPRAPIP